MKSLKHKLLSRFALAISVFALVGCSGEPSDSDVERAITEATDQAMAQLKESGVLSDNLVVTIHAIKKIGCAPAEGEAGYICDIESHVSTPMTGEVKGIEKYRLVEKDGSWLALEKIE